VPSLLLAADYPTEPMRDATPALGDPQRLRALATLDGYLYLPARVPAQAIEPVRALVRCRAEQLGWVEPEPGNPTVWQARPGARLRGRGWDDPQWVELQREVSNHKAFQSLVQRPEIMDVLQILYGEPAALAVTNHCWIKLPGSPEHTTRPHRDAYYLPTCPRLWTAWLPLTRTPAEVGPLGVVAGSHASGLWPQSDPMLGIAVPQHVTWSTGPFEPGDVVLFGPETIHCAWANMSPSAVRVSLDVRFEPRATPGSILRPG